MHRDLYALLFGEAGSFVVAGVGVAGDADSGIAGEHALDAAGHHLASIRNSDLAGVLRVADADAAAVVDTDPAGAACGVEQGVEQGPISNRIGTIFHGFSLAEGRGDGAAIEVVAAHHDGRFDLAALYQIVDGEAELGALAVAEPADARGQSLEMDTLPGEVDPALENLVVRKHFEHEIVGDRDVGGIAGECDPAERPAAFAEQRRNVGGHEARKIVSVLDTALERKGTDVVAVVESV